MPGRLRPNLSHPPQKFFTLPDAPWLLRYRLSPPHVRPWFLPLRTEHMCVSRSRLRVVADQCLAAPLWTSPKVLMVLAGLLVCSAVIYLPPLKRRRSNHTRVGTPTRLWFSSTVCANPKKTPTRVAAFRMGAPCRKGILCATTFTRFVAGSWLMPHQRAIRPRCCYRDRMLCPCCICGFHM